MRQTDQRVNLKIYLLFSLVFFIGRIGFCDTSQAWFKNTATFSLSPKWSLKVTQETRNLDITYSNPYLKNISGGFVYRLPKNFYFSAVYKREHVEIQDIVYNENRIILEPGWKTKLSHILDLDIYFRTEIREFEEEYPEDHVRFRLRLRLKTSLNIGKLELKPFIADETFGKAIYTIQKNRFYVGTSIPFGEHVELSLGYILLSARDVEPIHILYSGFQLNF